MPKSGAAQGTLSPRLNQLLAALPPEELEALRPDLENVPLAFRQVLYEPERPLEHVYFPHRGVASLLTQLEDGSSIEVATVGPEGIVGLTVFLGETTVSGKCFVQVPGEAARMGTDAFRRALARSPKLHQLLSRYTLALLNQLAQNSACNRSHSVEERLARWLLLTEDRVHEPTFPMTQEFMSQMLGVSRPTVSMTASILQKAGFITYMCGARSPSPTGRAWRRPPVS